MLQALKNVGVDISLIAPAQTSPDGIFRLLTLPMPDIMGEQLQNLYRNVQTTSIDA
jgi:hypothetical protein